MHISYIRCNTCATTHERMYIPTSIQIHIYFFILARKIYTLCYWSTIVKMSFFSSSIVFWKQNVLHCTCQEWFRREKSTWMKTVNLTTSDQKEQPRFVANNFLLASWKQAGRWSMTYLELIWVHLYTTIFCKLQVDVVRKTNSLKIEGNPPEIGWKCNNRH